MSLLMPVNNASDISDRVQLQLKLPSPASPPPCPSSANINMHVIRAGVAGGVDAEAAHEIRVLQLDDLHRQTYHTAVDRGDFSVAVGIYGHVGGVTVLVLT